MSDDTSGLKGPASGLPVLFSQGGTDYLRLQKLEEGPFGEKLYLCRPRTGQTYGALVEIAVLDRQGRRIGHARMQEAARLGALLSHPAIPRVHGQYKHRGTRYLVTEYVSGISMNMACSCACVRDRPLSESFILHVASRVAGVLSYVHGLTDAEGRALRIIHRNVNPYTLIMRDDGEMMLAHFTAAFSRLPGREPTTTWKVRGELDFAAPERLCHAVDAPVDDRSDLFSLGLVMLELATGEHLYHTEEVERPTIPPTVRGKPSRSCWRRGPRRSASTRSSSPRTKPCGRRGKRTPWRSTGRPAPRAGQPAERTSLGWRPSSRASTSRSTSSTGTPWMVSSVLPA